MFHISPEIVKQGLTKIFVSSNHLKKMYVGSGFICYFPNLFTIKYVILVEFKEKTVESK